MEKRSFRNSIVTEGRTLQKNLRRMSLRSTILDSDNPEMLFANKLFDGNVKDALHLLSNNNEGGVLNPNDKITCGNITTTVLEALKSKHPEGKPASRDAILPVKSKSRAFPYPIPALSSHNGRTGFIQPAMGLFIDMKT